GVAADGRDPHDSSSTRALRQMGVPIRSRAFWIAVVEGLAWAAGVVCLVYVALQYRDGVTGAREAKRAFTERKRAERHRPESVDVTLWSDARIKAWQSTRDLPGPSPLAVLRIPRIHLEVPVLEGTDEIALNRGTGHIEDTAMPGAEGNVGVAGHRDGFFR